MIEAKTLPQIVDLARAEISHLLKNTHFGHLAVCRDDRPYVVPITFAYDSPRIYFFTTEGLKTDMIDANPRVCLQVEEIEDAFNWKSVIVDGIAEQLTVDEDVERGMKAIHLINPKLAPAWSIRWLDSSIRANVPVVYRIDPLSVSGRGTLEPEK